MASWFQSPVVDTAQCYGAESDIGTVPTYFGIISKAASCAVDAAKWIVFTTLAFVGMLIDSKIIQKASRYYRLYIFLGLIIATIDLVLSARWSVPRYDNVGILTMGALICFVSLAVMVIEILDTPPCRKRQTHLRPVD